MEITTTIVGAGVVGLAVAAELSKTRKGILILERNPSFGQETSSRNSEVIHAGIYYARDSLKARLCVEGNRLLYPLCEQHRIPHRRCGKLIVATEKDEEAILATIQDRARENGAEALELLSARRIKALEPNVKACAALFSPSTGIIHSHRLMRHYAARANKNGARFVPQTTVSRVEKQEDGRYRVHVAYPDGQTDAFASRWIINCAGLESDRLAESMGIDIDACGYRLSYWKGEYFSLDAPPGFIRHLVYPVPPANHVGLGVHATIDMGGRVKFGPNATYLPDRDLDYSVNPAARQSFYEAARRYLPGIALDQLQPEMTGIRPKLQKPGDPARDFIIAEESSKGFPGVINLIGIESPGLTASPAIARHVAAMVAEQA
ncbi:NAD(P)/FAD-dependent oxidoreductase [uncultured Desulfosarcina sp.]|uniref:NAD(P)/FAD-dependent oxidoreductase n=1 Tax=uncultured Desulfosarcina sp. TaxID=218289 RepID=UPI0029C9A37C|nr:NAD(P)/FAD-dependent oxidoreductase [uncultured Desulfosarcina sp.]